INIDTSTWQSDDVELTTAISVPPDPNELASDSDCLGMAIQTVSDELKNKYHLDDAWGNIGCVVTDVKPGSAADLAGIRAGDGLVSIAGRQVNSAFSMKRRLEERALAGSNVEVVFRRSCFNQYKGESDLSSALALKVDQDNLYLAVKVRDDTHVQEQDGLRLPDNDCLQFALDPILERRDGGYGENNHEFAFALRGNETIVWRRYGRQGQPLTRSTRVNAKVVRVEDSTIYEAAIPLSELSPMCPSIWPKFGANIVISDNDGTTDKRKGRLELVPGASSKNPQPRQFAVFECPDLGDDRRTSGALFWERRCMPVGGAAELTAVLYSPTEQRAAVRAELLSLDSPNTKSATAGTSISVGAKPTRYAIRLPSNSAPGRYKLRVSILDEGSRVVTEEQLSVFVYPP
ncbi:MAG: PDZ domain-containing protein, partial [Armatimonadetes bacterium]|nr:PDZ domain-containing protein [Armatimonadota bacterium]